MLDPHPSLSHLEIAQIPEATQEFSILADSKSNSLLKRSYLHNIGRDTLKFMPIKSKNGPKTQSAGFKFIEVMIAVAIVGILVPIGC